MDEDSKNPHLHALDEARRHPNKVLEEQPVLDGEPEIKDIEADLTPADWHKVVDAYALTGSVHAIQQHTKLSPSKIRHLLEYGLVRIGLPPIRKKLVIEAQNKLAKLATPNLPEPTRAAIESRQVNETKAAQTSLLVQRKVANVLGRYLDELMTRIDDGRVKLLIPDEVTPSYLERISNAASKNAAAVQAAIRASRNAAGEASEALKLQVEHLLAVAKLTDEEVIRIRHGEIPHQLKSLIPPTRDVSQDKDKDIPDHSNFIDLPEDK